MGNFYYLDLPPDPLIPLAKESIIKDIANWTKDGIPWKERPTWNIYTDRDFVRKALRQDVLDTLGASGLDPRLFVVFFTEGGTRERSFVHKDLAYYKNVWTLVPCAINFEINPNTTAEISWFKTDHMPGFYDDTEWNRENKKYLMSIRYDRDYDKCSPGYLGLEPEESVTVVGNSKSVLVRTDVAHNVIANTSVGLRCNVSLRFSLDKIQSFKQAVKMLDHLIIRDI